MKLNETLLKIEKDGSNYLLTVRKDNGRIEIRDVGRKLEGARTMSAVLVTESRDGRTEAIREKCRRQLPEAEEKEHFWDQMHQHLLSDEDISGFFAGDERQLRESRGSSTNDARGGVTAKKLSEPKQLWREGLLKAATYCRREEKKLEKKGKTRQRTNVCTEFLQSREIEGRPNYQPRQLANYIGTAKEQGKID